jgi:hypothetical protein
MMDGLKMMLISYGNIVCCLWSMQIIVQDEGWNMWQVYLCLKEYIGTLEHCQDSLQWDCVYATQVFPLAFVIEKKPRFLECNVLYLMMCGMFSLQEGLKTIHMFQSLMLFFLFHSKTKKWLHAKELMRMER